MPDLTLPQSASDPGWSDWQTLGGMPAMTSAALAETLDGGQAFRWSPQPGNTWLGQWADHVVRVRHAGARSADAPTGHVLEWSAPSFLAASVATALPAYLGADRDFAALTDALPWRSDPHLARCIEEFRGLRILRQPFGETLLGFLCSATKQIVQIKQMMALLAGRHGAPLVSLSTLNAQPSNFVHRLPTWPELAAIPEATLRTCQLGFRAKFIHETAQLLEKNPGWLDETEALPYAVAKERLCSLPGVGEKIADCVLLFGAGRLEAFPVDTWILKALARRYGLDDWKPAHVAHFGRMHFGPLAGLAQQYLFSYERKFSLREN